MRRRGRMEVMQCRLNRRLKRTHKAVRRAHQWIAKMLQMLEVKLHFRLNYISIYKLTCILPCSLSLDLPFTT